MHTNDIKKVINERALIFILNTNLVFNNNKNFEWITRKYNAECQRSEKLADSSEQMCLNKSGWQKIY